jgi:oligopeptide transport system substrate-binding protein
LNGPEFDARKRLWFMGRLEGYAMRILLTWAGLLVVLVALGLYLAHKSFDSSAGWAKPGQGVVRWSIGDEHRSRDPQGVSWLHDIRVADCLFETLLKVELPSLKTGAGTAESWSVSEDGLNYTYKIRADAKWSNGDPVVAGDFIYAWRRLLMPDSAGEYAELFYDVKGAQPFFARRAAALKEYGKSENKEKSEAKARALYDQALADFEKNVGFKVVDEKTVQITLERPVAYFNEVVSFTPFGPNHAKSVDANSVFSVDSGMYRVSPDYFNNPEKLVCNGPYRLDWYRFKVGSRMPANPHYWNRKNMGNNGVEERIMDKGAALVLYRHGELDWLPELPTVGPVASDLVSSGRTDVHKEPWAGTYFYNFNCAPKLASGEPNPLANMKLRQALSLAVDRKAIVEQVTRMNQPVARSFVPPGAVIGYVPPVEAGYGLDVARAKQLLVEAGYRDPADVKGLTVLYNSGQGHELIAQAIKSMWKTNLGVEVSLEAVDTKQFGKRLRGHEFSISRASWIGDYRDPTTFLNKHKSDGESNDCSYKNPEYDKLLEEASVMLDAQQRLRTLEKAEALFLHDAPIMPISQSINLQVYDDKRLEKVYPNIWNFRRIEFITPAK